LSSSNGKQSKKINWKLGAKMWLCETIYQMWHLKIPILGIFELPSKL
jgi:hypothetical protein